VQAPLDRRQGDIDDRRIGDVEELNGAEQHQRECPKPLTHSSQVGVK
jgi:hypothetical protein